MIACRCAASMLRHWAIREICWNGLRFRQFKSGLEIIMRYVLLLAVAGLVFFSGAADAQVAETQGVITVEDIKKPVTGNECYFALLQGQHLSDIDQFEVGSDGKTWFILHDVHLYVVTRFKVGNARELSFRCSHKLPLKIETRKYR